MDSFQGRGDRERGGGDGAGGIVVMTGMRRHGGRQSDLLLGKMAPGFNIYTAFCPLCLTYMHWILVFLQVEFKRLLITFTALHDTDYLQDCLSLRIAACSTRSDEVVGMLQVCSLKSCQLVGPWKRACSVAAPTLWNTTTQFKRPHLSSFSKDP